MSLDQLPQHHFVVCYDTKTEKWFIDWETTDNNMPDGQVFVNRSWEMPIDDEENDPDGYGRDYYTKASELESHLNTLHTKGMVVAPSLGVEMKS